MPHTYRILIFHENETVEPRTSNGLPELSEVQKTVGGYIQTIPFANKPAKIDFYGDEDGKLKNKPINRLASLTLFDLNEKAGTPFPQQLVGTIWAETRSEKAYNALTQAVKKVQEELKTLPQRPN